MLAHTVLIITSNLAGRMPPNALDRAIKQLVWLKKNPILVLGADGDDVIRMCSQIEACEMLFDPNGNSDFSPVKAGLHATDAPAYVWQADRPFPANDVWRSLDSIIRQTQVSDVDLLRFDGDPSGLFLATQTGVRRLKERSSELAWPVADDIKIRLVAPGDLPVD